MTIHGPEARRQRVRDQAAELAQVTMAVTKELRVKHWQRENVLAMRHRCEQVLVQPVTAAMETLGISDSTGWVMRPVASGSSPCRRSRLQSGLARGLPGR
jgi:hypothetical protein